MDLSQILRPILEQIAKLWGRVDKMPVIRWGTVTQVSPLRVQLDGDAEPLALTPNSAVRMLNVGDRLVCVEQHRRVTGIAGLNALAKHITEATSTGRTYFGTGSTATNQSATYIGMSPESDTSTTSAFWFMVNGSQKLAIDKDGHQISPHMPFAMASGQVNASVSFPVVTFPAGRFTAVPRVQAQLISGAGADVGITTMVTNVTTTSFQVRHTGASGSRLIDWTAVQMTPTSGSG